MGAKLSSVGCMPAMYAHTSQQGHHQCTAGQDTVKMSSLVIATPLGMVLRCFQGYLSLTHKYHTCKHQTGSCVLSVRLESLLVVRKETKQYLIFPLISSKTKASAVNQQNKS